MSPAHFNDCKICFLMKVDLLLKFQEEDHLGFINFNQIHHRKNFKLATNYDLEFHASRS